MSALAPESGHSRLHLECPLSANSGILPGLSYDECTARVPPTARPARTKRSRSSNADSSVLGHAIRLPSSPTNRFGQRIRDQIMGSIVMLAAHNSSAVLGQKLFCNKSRYVRNMTEGAPFTAIGLKDAGDAGTALQKEKVQLSCD